MLAYCHNTYPDLLSLQGNFHAETQRFSIQICPGTIGLDIVTGKVRFGLTGFQLEVWGGEAETFDWKSLIPQFLAQLSGQCAESHWQALSSTNSTQALIPALSGFSLTSEGLRQILNLEGSHSSEYPVEFRLGVTAADLRVVDSEGIWHHDIHPNTQGVLERALVHHFFQSRLTGWLSYAIVGNTGNRMAPDPSDPSLEASDLMGANTLNDRSLMSLVESLMQSSGDLPTLLSIAQLDPLQALKGGQFMAGDFRNVDLSGADLARSNLRGSDLSDGDFTEANLSYARLSGADLSGALLSNVNFRGANLHRASLALANLSGADLRDADLIGANLRNVNFGGTQVQGLRWGNNEGITPELEDYLRSSGALFSV
jgi:uncharacterized protein YjbI with pentapeptide repeats